MQAGDTCGSGTATCKMDACCKMMGCTGPAPETPAPTQAPTVAPTEAATTPALTVAPTPEPKPGCSAEEMQGAWQSGRCSNLNGPSNECKSMQAGDTCGSGTATCKMDACCKMMGCTGPAPETPAPTQAPTVAPTEAATTPAPEPQPDPEPQNECQGAWQSGRCSNLNGPSNECQFMQAGDTCGSGTATCEMDNCCSTLGCTGPAPETAAPTQAPTVAPTAAPTEAATTPAPTVAPTQAPSKVPNSIDVMVPSGAKLLPVVSSAGFSIGDKIVIDAGTPIEEYNTIIGFGSLVLATPLKYDHAPGTIVSPVTHTGSAGATAPLNAAGFKSTTALCCPPEMEVFFTRLLESKGLKVCSIPHLQGLMHWFSCVPDMDFQYVIDVIENGNPCKYWAPAGESCPELSSLCSGHYCR